MVEDRGATHEGTQIEDKPPAAEEEEASKAAVKRAVSRTQGEASSDRETEGGVAHISGNLGREGLQVPRRLEGEAPLPGQARRGRASSSRQARKNGT